jgi:hypothetical protein
MCSNNKSRWDYLGKKPQTVERTEEYGKLSTRPEDYSKDDKWRLFENLPEDLKHAIFSAKVAATNWNLGQKYALDNRVVSKFAEWEGHVFIGILPPKQFKDRLAKDLGIDSDVAEALFMQINELIFGPVRESLDNLYKNQGEA